MAPKLKLSLSMLVAVVLTEAVCIVLSRVWYWTDTRYPITSLLCDAGLACFLKYILDNVWIARRWQEGVQLAGYLSAFYFFLVAPNLVAGFYGFMQAAFLTGHVFIVVSVMLLVMIYIKK